MAGRAASRLVRMPFPFQITAPWFGGVTGTVAMSTSGGRKTIQFRCWYCNKRYAVAENRARQLIDCTCQRRLRVPRRSGGSSRYRTPLDWFLEITLYGGGGALLGFGLAVLILSQALRVVRAPYVTWAIISTFTLAGLLVGIIGRERGVEWIGRIIRNREDR